MREVLQLYINGQCHHISGSDAWLTLSDYLRQRRRLTGTKIVCEEGDCGSCSVLIADLADNASAYFPIDACIAFLFQLDGFHIVTVEGLAEAGELTSVQQAMVDCHGSQCGFCTPGFVMSMTGVLERTGTPRVETAKCGNDRPDDSVSNSIDWPLELSGNLCRCTGYQPILNACHRSLDVDYRRLEFRYPMAELRTLYQAHRTESVAIRNGSDACFLPRELEECLALKNRYLQARLVAGATDVGVQSNKRKQPPQTVIGLGRVAALRAAQVTDDALVVGAAVTWTQLLELCQQHLPEFAEIIRIFGSPQIRNMGTLGGNLANASPISDALPVLHVLDAELELASTSGRRWVNVNRFYQGYKRFDLRPDELISRVKIPLVAEHERLRLYKVSRRRDMDIATFTAAIRMRVESGQISLAKLAMGAVGPIVLRLSQTEKYLVGNKFTPETMMAAGQLAAQEITPISDVRGSTEFRMQLAKNSLLKFYYEETL